MADSSSGSVGSADMTLRVITPEKIALDEVVSSVQIPGVDGSVGILQRHAPMVVALGPGALRYRQGGQTEAMFVSGGFAEVRDNTVRVVTEAGEAPTEIDMERARAAEKRARERLSMAGRKGPDPIDLLRAEASLRRAIMRQRLSAS